MLAFPPSTSVFVKHTNLEISRTENFIVFFHVFFFICENQSIIPTHRSLEDGPSTGWFSVQCSTMPMLSRSYKVTTNYSITLSRTLLGETFRLTVKEDTVDIFLGIPG